MFLLIKLWVAKAKKAQTQNKKKAKMQANIIEMLSSICPALYRVVTPV